MPLLDRLPSWMKNKYLLTALGFTIWLIFFDDRDLINNFRHHQELKALETNRDYYIKENEKIRQELELLKNYPSISEKYAREKYRMKKDNEDLYIVPE